MKSLQQHIEERLIINKNYKSLYTEHPNNYEELSELIKQRVKENPEEPYLLDIDVTNIDDFDGLFNVEKDQKYYLKHTKKIDLSTWDVSNVKEFGGMFSRNPYVEYIDLSEWDLKSAQSILSMFYGCSNLKEIKGIEDFDLTNLEKQDDPGDAFGDDAFYDCNPNIIPSWWASHKAKYHF